MSERYVYLIMICGLVCFIASGFVMNVLLWRATLNGEVWLIAMIAYQLLQGIGMNMALKLFSVSPESLIEKY